MANISINLIKTLEYNGKNARVWDDKLKGFGISIQKDSMSYFIMYRDEFGKQKYYTFGRVGVLAPDEARRDAKLLLAGITRGMDPAAKRNEDKNTMTVGELCDWYLREGSAHKKPKTRFCDNSAVTNHIKPLIGNMPLKSINRTILERFVRDIETGDKTRRREKSKKPRGIITVRGGVSAATHALTLMGAIFEFAIRHEKMDKNPAHGIKRPPNNIRDTFLTHDEIIAFGGLLARPGILATYKIAVDAIKLLLLTGCRKNEILSLKWDYIDFEKQCFRFPDTKTGPQVRPFGLGALHLLRELGLTRDHNSPFVFPATRESKGGYLIALYKMLNMIMDTCDDNGNIIFEKPGLTLHALRHTFASLAHSLEKYSELTIGALLGHNAKRSIVTLRYIHTVDKSLIAAADDVSLLMEQLLAPTSAKMEVDNAQPEKEVNPGNFEDANCAP
jgi:integrase